MPRLFQLYVAVLKEYISKGYARGICPAEAAIIGPKIYYLPHNPVFNVNKPGKFRVVKDAPATSCGVSLNSLLKTGPDLLNSLVGVIIRLRSGRIAIAADIEGTFHHLRLQMSDVL